MIMKKVYLILILIFSITSCSGKKKQTLDPEGKNEKNQTEVSDFSSIEVFKGDKKKEIRKTDPTNPPITIDISGNIESKNLDITSSSSKVNFIKLKHPKENEGKAFKIRNNRYTVGIPPMGGMIQLVAGVPSPTFLAVEIYKDWILIGNLSGLFCYTKEGEYLYTLLECSEFDDANMSNSLSINMNEGYHILCGFSVMDDVCAFASSTQGKATLHFFDLTQGKEIYRKTMPITQVNLLNGKHKTFLNYDYEVRAKESLPFMYTLTAENDTICSFYNKNIFTDMTGMSTFQNPGDPNIYNYKDRLYVAQQGNDTIYRFRSEYEINPAYVFQTGKYQATIQDLIKGNTKDKRSVSKVIETDQLLIFSLKGIDDVFYYDKSLRKTYKSPLLFKDDGLEVLPTTFRSLRIGSNTFYNTYTKQIFNNMIKNAKEFGFTEKEISSINKWKEELEDGEILLMILE